MTPKPARALAWLTFAVGILVSVLGNIGHAASDGMRPGEWAGAAFWPLALLLSVEILVRVRWQPQKRWLIARFTGLIVVSIVAAILSYLHLRSLLIFWEYGAFQGSIGPLAVDGLMLIAASALLSISHEAEVVRPEPVKVPVSAPEQVPVSSEPPAVEADSKPESPRDKEISGLAEQLHRNAFVDEHIKVTEPDKPRKVPTSKTVPPSAAEEAAFQAWMNAPADNKPSVRKLAGMYGMSPATVHRRINEVWKPRAVAR